jgi:hypothetical protein
MQQNTGESNHSAQIQMSGRKTYKEHVVNMYNETVQ